MSVIDILTRVDAICKKYDKYGIDKQKDINISCDDAFARLYAVVEADIDAALQKSELAVKEKNKASAVALNAKIHQTKARMLEEVPKLQRLANKKVSGLTKEELATVMIWYLLCRREFKPYQMGPQMQPSKLEGGHPLLIHKLNLTQHQMDDLTLNSFNKLKSQANLGGNMKCEK